MAEFVVNVALLLAVLVGVITIVVSGVRNRRDARDRALAERSLVLQAILAQPPDPRPFSDPTADPGASHAGSRDEVNDELVLELLKRLHDRGSRRGVLVGPLGSPISAWHAGERAARSLGQRRR